MSNLDQVLDTTIESVIKKLDGYCIEKNDIISSCTNWKLSDSVSVTYLDMMKKEKEVFMIYHNGQQWNVSFSDLFDVLKAELERDIIFHKKKLKDAVKLSKVLLGE